MAARSRQDEHMDFEESTLCTCQDTNRGLTLSALLTAVERVSNEATVEAGRRCEIQISERVRLGCSLEMEGDFPRTSWCERMPALLKIKA